MIIIGTKINISEKIKEFTWSFSRLNSFYTCKRMWYIQYILRIKGEGNFFSDYGTFFHKMMEAYDKGELQLYELLDYYSDNFKANVCHKAPPNKYVSLYDTYYQKGIDYLMTFDGHDDETVAVEKQINVTFPFNGDEIKVVGYIDRLSKDKNGLIITDYKSKGKFTNKSEKEHYLLQLYLYSIGAFDLYGEYPYLLNFDMFRAGVVVSEKFDKKKIDIVENWIFDTIRSIINEKDFCRKTDNIRKDFFCQHLCSCKDQCVKMGK